MVDRSLNPGQLIADNHSEIFGLWMNAVIDEIPEAKALGKAELADHLKLQIDEIVSILKKVTPETSLEDLFDININADAGKAHGRERSAVANYGIAQLVHEYFVLKKVILVFCHDTKQLNKNYEALIGHIIEFATLAAVKEYVLSVQKIQQKLIGTLVHDVRTPLSVAYSYAELLGAKSELSEPEKNAMVSTITRNLDRSVTMLEDLLDTVKDDMGNGLFMRFQSADLNEVLNMLHSEVSQVYQREIVADLENHAVEGIFDQTMIVRTMENLLSNAVKFGDKNSPITLSLVDGIESATVTIHNMGEPIKEEDQKNIFDFFSKGTEKISQPKKGWGLGLSLIKVVAEKHGGEMIFNSSRESGTTFGMTLYKNHRHEDEEITVNI